MTRFEDMTALEQAYFSDEMIEDWERRVELGNRPYIDPDPDYIPF